MTWGFVTCGPNEALVISGCCYSKPLLVPGGRAFIWPTIQRIQRICLNTMTLIVDSPTVYTSQGVPISVTGIAQVKIQGQNEEMLLAACEQFLGKSESEIQHIALVTLEGHQRAIMGSMTVEEIYKDRKKFSKQVFEVASSDLVNMGITVVSYTLKDIRDEEGYLKSLGMARTAEVKRDARIGEAEARADAQIKEAIAEEQRMASVFLNDTEIAKAKRDFELKKAAYDVEVQTKNAEAEMAYELQAAKTPTWLPDGRSWVNSSSMSELGLVCRRLTYLAGCCTR
jgi:flotillin